MSRKISKHCKLGILTALLAAVLLGACESANCQMSGARKKEGTTKHSEFDKELEELCSSIDRSRKRHLSVGLLRGEQVHDRLRPQEISASPLLKKIRAAEHFTPSLSPPQESDTDMAMTMADFKAYMEEHSTRRLVGIENTMQGIKASVEKVEASVEVNSAKIDKHEAQISAIREEVRQMKDRPAPDKIPGPSWAEVAAPTDVEDVEYDNARRSLRLWPIAGFSDRERWDAVRTFLEKRLGMAAQIREDMVEAVKKAEIPSGPGVVEEVIVTFKEAQTRDSVIGSASRLAPYVDQTGRATAGMRIEVPRRLRPDFRLLFRYGRNLKMRHGEGTRKHVKFDDATRRLYLNIKLPGDEQWSRVSTEVARRGLRAREVLSDDMLERRLDITGPLTSRPRSSSTTAMETNAEMQTTAPWTGRRAPSASTSS